MLRPLLALLVALTASPVIADDAADFDARVAALAPGDIEGATALAFEAANEGWMKRADSLCRVILHFEPDREDVYQLLVATAQARPLPSESRSLTAAEDALGDAFARTETEHFVLLSDADPVWVRTQGHRLERAHDRFLSFANALDLRPWPLRHKLVAIAFDDSGDFRTFAQAHSGPSNPRVIGYYDPRADYLVFFHAESTDNIEQARSRLESMRGEIANMQRSARQLRQRGDRRTARTERERAKRAARHVDAQEMRLNEFARMQSVAVTVHEAVHQLAFHTGIQSPRAPQPVWLSEGLATAFETDEVGTAFGPWQEFAPREEAFEVLRDEGRLLPLEDLVTWSRADPIPADIAYAQGYGFVTWLCKHRRAGLKQYLRSINRLRSEGAEAQRAAFIEAFGSIERLERAWLGQ